MLDECKGEKFEEVLAAFSTIVLQKVLDADQNSQPSWAKKLAISQRLSSGEQRSLLPLAIVHRGSLTALLRKKSLLRAKYQELQGVLDAKELELRTKAQSLEVGEASEKRVRPAEKIRRLKDYFDIHWQGDPRWIDAIFGGEEDDKHDSLLDSSFSEVWSKVTDKKAEQPASEQQGLLQQLEKRVAAQEARLQQWKRFREDFVVTATKAENHVPRAKPNLGLDLKFLRHTVLDVNPNDMEKKDTEDPPNQEFISAILGDYQNLIRSMRTELARVDEVKHSNNHTLMAVSTEKSVTDGLLKSLRDPGIAKGATKKPGYSKSKKFPVRANKKTEVENSDLTRTPAEPFKFAADSDQESSSSKKSQPLPLKFESTQTVQLTEAPEIETNEEGFLAQQIISSTLNALSPIKPKLSLLERTRRSMALAIPEGVSQSTGPVLVTSPSIATGAEGILHSPDATSKRRETLLERTRQSMSLLPPKPQKKPEQRRASKIYPTNQFGTPEKAPRVSNAELSTPPEVLFSQDVNYASVFKSRPKVALSPIMTPMSNEGFHDLDDIMEAQLLDDGFGGSSPLTRATERVGRI